MTANPNLGKYRLTEVSLIGGGETGYSAYLKRRRPLLRPWVMRRLGLHASSVNPVMTREMLDAFVADMQEFELRARAEGKDVVIVDASDEARIDDELVAVEMAESDRPSLRITPDRHGLYALAGTAAASFGLEWVEIIPPWPSGHVDAETILRLLTAPSPDIRPIENRIMARADMRELARAIELTDDTRLRARICFLLHMNPPSDSALLIPALLPLLNDPDSRLRGNAADAVLAIAHSEGHGAALATAPNAGQVAFAALTSETDDFARAMLAGAVGQLHYEPAIPTLIDMLRLPDEQVRRTAAWSLGDMRAAQAAPALRHALETETDKYAAIRMREAIAAIEA